MTEWDDWWKLTWTETTPLQVDVRDKSYEGARHVSWRLRAMSDDDLERTYVQGLREQAEGPADGDTRRTEFLLRLVQEEIDRRIEEGPTWLDRFR